MAKPTKQTAHAKQPFISLMHLLEPGGRKLVGLASPPEEEGADVAITPASSPQKACSLYSPSNSLGGEKNPHCNSLREKNRTMEELD